MFEIRLSSVGGRDGVSLLSSWFLMSEDRSLNFHPTFHTKYDTAPENQKWDR